jgi:hypothetical protein
MKSSPSERIGWIFWLRDTLRNQNARRDVEVRWSSELSRMAGPNGSILGCYVPLGVSCRGFEPLARYIAIPTISEALFSYRRVA